MNKFAFALKEARLKKGLKQEDVAKIVGKTKNVVSNWERGDNKPDIDTIEILCNKLDIDIGDIININPSEPGDFKISNGSIIDFTKLSDDNKKKLESYYLFLLSCQSDENM